MKYYLVNKNNNEIIRIMHNRQELLYTIRNYHSFMYYCTNGAHNYNNATLIEIFNQIESEFGELFITRENKYIYHYCIDNDINNDIMEV